METLYLIVIREMEEGCEMESEELENTSLMLRLFIDFFFATRCKVEELKK